MRALPSGKVNGYAVGKSRLNLTMTAYWLPDLEEGKILFVRELYEDFPKTQADELYKNAEPYRLYMKKTIASFTETL